jgi:hypothetical protein
MPVASLASDLRYSYAAPHLSGPFGLESNREEVPMRRYLILFGLVLAIGAAAADAPQPSADPLDGKIFRTVK